MATTRPFAFNTGSTITGTSQTGELAVGIDALRYDLDPGGVKWWMGCDEDPGYVICWPIPNTKKPKFVRSPGFTDQGFIDIANKADRKTGGSGTFTNSLDAENWVNAEGYWTLFTGGTGPTPTPTPTQSAALTPTPTPTISITPTPTPTPSGAFVPSGPEMITTWDTTNTSVGSSASNQIELPLRGDVQWYNSEGPQWETIPASDYDFWVDWGEGGGWETHITTHTGTTQLYTYSSTGIYEVKIKGQFGSFHFNNDGDRLKLTDISQFDDMIFDCGMDAFRGCANLGISATDTPDLALTKVSSINGEAVIDWMFGEIPTFNKDFTGWDFSNATYMKFMFVDCPAFNNGGSPSISGWTMTTTKSIYGIFRNCSAFNQPVGSWDTSSVLFMADAFHGATIFNQNIGGWDTSSAINTMDNMFYAASAFNNGGSSTIDSWVTSGVTNIQTMFYQATAFNQPIGSWDVSNVTAASSMFSSAEAFNQNIGGWDISNMEYINYMFSNAKAFNNGGNSSIGTWELDSAIQINGMFNTAEAFNQDIGAWEFPNASNMNNMFARTLVFDQDISGWAMSGITNLSFMFYLAKGFNQDIGAWDVSNVNTMENTFYQCTPFNNGGSPSISGWTTSSVTNMGSLFAGTNFNQDIGAWDVSSAESLRWMFYGTPDFNNAGSSSIDNWITSGVTNMEWMFYATEAFDQDISSWDVSNVTNMSSMFFNAEAFSQDIGPWDVSSVENMSKMFGTSSSGDPWLFNTSAQDWDPTSLVTGGLSGLDDFFNQTTHIMPTVDYDQLLINWDALGVSLPDDIYAGFGGSKYTGGGAAATARAALVTKGWTITDGGTV